MNLKKQLLGMAVMILLVFSAQAFSQTNASITGSITDESGGALPGASVTVTDSATGSVHKILTNSAGVYNVPGLPGGTYKVTAEMTGFQTQTKTDVSLVASAVQKVSFTMKIAARNEQIEVSAKAENLLLEQSSSVGVVLPEEKISELPLVSSNVLDLIKVMGGVNMTDSPTFGADRTTFAGISAANVNLQRDGVTVNDVRWATGLSSPVYLNPELIGEFKLVIAPVDAEMGRGSGQVQVITRSGANDFHGSAVWNIQNSALDANQWGNNLITAGAVNSYVRPNWRNQEEYTLSAGGPIIKNKAFFFVSWDQQIVRIREHNINPQVLTKCAEKSIFRWFYGYGTGNNQTVASNGTTRSAPITLNSTDKNGNPLLSDIFNNLKLTGPITVPAYMPTTGAGIIAPGTAYDPATNNLLQAASVFGPLAAGKTPAMMGNDCENVAIGPDGYPTSAWVDYGANGNQFDSYRVKDTTGSVMKFLSYTPTGDVSALGGPNNWDVGDGLNTAGYRWTRSNDGIDNVYGLGEGPNRKQLSFRLDWNITASHRLSGGYSWETDHGEDAQPMWPVYSYGGVITRDPRSFNASLTSTLRPTLLNEFRWGYSKTESFVTSPLYNNVTGGAEKLRALYKDIYDPSQIPGWNTDVPIVMGLGTIYAISGGSNPYGSGRGNFGTYWGGHDPRMIFADTLTWTKGKHSFKFGGETQRASSWQAQNGSISFGDSNMSFPYARSGASANAPNKGLYTAGVNIWALPGMVGTGTGQINNMYNLTNMMAGSLSSVGQWYFINKPDWQNYNEVQNGEDMQITEFHQNQFNFFFKDDWKVTDNLTLNLGVRYEFYGVPFLADGLTPGLKGGSYKAFSYSGSSWDDFWASDWTYNPTPGTPYAGSYKGELAETAFIGPNSANPGQQLYNDDYNNFGPAVGFAYQLPWFGKGKTTLRGGYQMNYLTLGRASLVSAPGMVRDYSYAGADRTGAAAYMSLKDLANVNSGFSQLVPVPLPTYMVPPAVNPILPANQRQQASPVYDPNLTTPYVHNLTLSLTRNIGSNLTVDLRYIGTLSRKQTSSINLNTSNYLTNGLKEMFDCARYNTVAACGATAPGDATYSGSVFQKLDQMFWNINLNNPLYGYGPTGTIKNGTYQSGALQLRASQGLNLANGDYNALAGTLATLNINPTYNPQLTNFVPTTYTAGSVLRWNGFPENWIYTSPQYSSSSMTMNLNHANYHSMQAQVTLRPTHGLSLSGTYTWSRNLGALGYIDIRDRTDDYGLLNTHRSHAFTSYGTYDLPFGPNRQLFSDVNPNILGRIIGGWQLSIQTMQSGRPMSLSTTTGISGNGRAQYVGTTPYDTKSGHVVWDPNARTGNYFNMQLLATVDPQCSSVTTAQFLNYSCFLRAMSKPANQGDPGAVQTLVKDPSDPTGVKYLWGVPLFENPAPGTRGNFAAYNFTSPLTWNTDMALTKVIRISEGKSFQLRIDATNVFNHPFPSNGNFGSSGSRTVAPGDFAGNISSMDLSWLNPILYGNRSAGYLDSKVGSRTFQAKVRFDF